MKEKESIVDCPEQQLILYVEKENGKYGPLQTGSFISANYLDDYFLKRRNLELSLRKRVLDGEVSMVYYYMILVDLSLSELASRAGISKSRVKRHLDPKHFGNCTVDELTRYAGVFNVPVAAMITIDPHCTEIKIEESGK